MLCSGIREDTTHKSSSATMEDRSLLSLNEILIGLGDCVACSGTATAEVSLAVVYCLSVSLHHYLEIPLACKPILRIPELICLTVSHARVLHLYVV